MRKNASSPLSLIPTTPVPANDAPAAMTKPEPSLSALSAPLVPEGFDDLFEDDLVIPRYAIVQPTSHEGTPGTFRSNLSGEERKELRFVPLRIQRGRVLWSDTLGEDPVCKSADGIVPAPGIEKPVNDACCVLAGRRLRPVCPMAMWQRNGNGDGAGRNEPPKCRDSYAMVGLDLETQTPFMIAFHGTGIRAVRVLRTVIFQKRLNLFDAACVLRLRKEQNGKGSYYVPDFAEVKAVERPGTHREQYEQFSRYEYEGTEERGLV